MVSVVDVVCCVGVCVEMGGNYCDLFFELIVLSGVVLGNLVFDEEIFGLVVIVVLFDIDEDVIVFVNWIEYGLLMVILFVDVGCVLWIGECLNMGLLYIND